jgi:hypothetical protein
MRVAVFSALVLAVSALPAVAQYRYPGGYGGWGGWGGAQTAQGSAAMGMGAFAAGAGAYNEQTAVARSINANTAMQVNEYMYQVNLTNAKYYYKRSADRQKEESAVGVKHFQRVHDNPNAHDIHSGDALNAVLDDLTNPKVFPTALKVATQPIDSEVVKNIQFQYAAKMIATSLEDLIKNGAPDVLQSPEFQEDREAFRPLVKKAHEEIDSQGRVSPETLARCRTVIKAAEDKAARILELGSSKRNEADNYLKALYGLTKMLQTPDVDKFLKGLDKYPTTTLGALLGFMHGFTLRFAPAKTPIQETYYEQLLPMLVALRDRVQAPPANPYAEPSGKPDPKALSQFFSGMDYSHFGPQPDPHTGVVPPAPRPGVPR